MFVYIPIIRHLPLPCRTSGCGNFVPQHFVLIPLPLCPIKHIPSINLSFKHSHDICCNFVASVALLALCRLQRCGKCFSLFLLVSTDEAQSHRACMWEISSHRLLVHKGFSSASHFCRGSVTADLSIIGQGMYVHQPTLHRSP